MQLMVLTLLGAMLVTTPAAAQGLLAKASVQHATVTGSTSAPTVAPGGSVTLWVDVVPDRSIHIYARGAKDFTPVSLVVTPNPSVVARRPTYPKADGAAAPVVPDGAPAPTYSQPFRISLPVSVASSVKAGETVTIAGAVNYQACDDRLCYAVAAAPVIWHVMVR